MSLPRLNPPSPGEIVVAALPSALLVTSAFAFFVASTQAAPVVLLLLALIVGEALLLTASGLAQPAGRPQAPDPETVSGAEPGWAPSSGPVDFGPPGVAPAPNAVAVSPFEAEADAAELQVAVAAALREQRLTGARRFVVHRPGLGFMVLDTPPMEPGAWYLRLQVGGAPILARTLTPMLAARLEELEQVADIDVPAETPTHAI